MRSLRPLLQRRPSRSQFEIDEEETAERIANALGQGWVPALRPLAERMFDLVLLIEESPSMGVWQDTVRDLRVLLIQTGIFRDVHTWAMVLEEATAADNTRVADMSLRVAHTVPGIARRTYEPSELVDPKQQRLILVVSDCSSAAWDNGAAMRLLKPLADSNAVSILQMLPEELWDVSALANAVQVVLSSRQIVTCNSQLEIQQLSKGWEPEQLKGVSSIPVVTLAPAELNGWAHFMMGRQQERAAGYCFPSDELVADASGGEMDLDAELRALGILPGASEPSIEARYSHFLSTVPPRARRLAAYFAAAPLTLPIMRMVQKALMGEGTTHADFVWVYYSSLIERTTPFTAETDLDQVQYDFVGGEVMRRRLLDSLPRYRIEQVQEALSRYVDENVDQLNSFWSALYVPGERGNVTLDDLSRHIAQVSATVLRYLGGVYAETAERLEQAVGAKIPLVRHQNGAPVWVAATLPERVKVTEQSTLSVRMYTSRPPQDTGAQSIHPLGVLRSGTQIQLRVDARDGSFIVPEDALQTGIAIDLSAATPARDIDLEANALGEAQVSLSFHTTSNNMSEKLTDISLSCTVVSERKEPTKSLRLRLDGDSLYRAGKYVEAEQKYAAAIKIGEDTSDVYQDRGRARHNRHKYREAEADYSAAIKRGAKDYWVYLDRGTTHSQQKKYDDAISDFSQAILISPSLVDAYEERAIALGQKGRYDLAEKDFGIAIEFAPTAQRYRNRGLSYQKLEKQEEALADYAAAIALDANYARTYRSRGDLYSEMKKDDLAIADYSRGLALEESADLYNSRGLVYKSQGKLDDALADYSKAIKLDPNYKWAYDNRGDLYHDRGEYRQAVAEYSRAIQIDPTYTRAYNQRGVAYKELGETDAALADFAEAIKLDPRYKWAHDNRGDLYRNRGEHRQAVTEYSEAIQVDPAYTAAYDGRGLAYKALGETDAALADFAQAIKLDPNYKWAYDNRGDLYHYRGDYRQAVVEHSRAIEIDPKYTRAYNQRGVALIDLGETDAALADFAEANRLDPNYKWAYDNRGDVYRERGEFRQAIEEYSKAIQIDPTYSEAYYERALAYRGLKDERAALADLDKAIEIDSKDTSFHITRVRVLEELEGADAAERECRRLLKTFPDNGRLFQELAEFYKRRGAVTDARAAYIQAEKAYSQELASKPAYYTFYNRGVVNHELYQWDRAISDFSEAIRIESFRADAYGERASCHMDIEAYDKAVSDYLSAIERNARDVYLQYNLALVYYDQRKYTEALAACQNGIDRQPENAHGYMVRGFIHARRQDSGLATQDAHRAVELDSEDRSVQSFCCAIYCWLADYATAIEYGSRAISLDPGDSSAYGWMGHSYLLSGNPAEAREHYNRAIYLAANRYSYRATIREIQDLAKGRPVQQGEVRRCVEMFEQAIAALDRR